MANAETVRLIKDVMRNRKGIGQVDRICICGNLFTHFDDGKNSWYLCMSCKRNGRGEIWKGGVL
jgi:hypothetical protein